VYDPVFSERGPLFVILLCLAPWSSACEDSRMSPPSQTVAPPRSSSPRLFRDPGGAHLSHLSSAWFPAGRSPSVVLSPSSALPAGSQLRPAR